MIVWLFVSNRFLIPINDSMIIKYQSFLPDYAVFLCHFYNDTELGLLFHRSTIHFDHYHHHYDYYQWPNDQILNIHKWQWFQSTNHIQRMVWNRICSIVIANWLLRIIKKIGFDSGTMEWFEWIDICWWSFTFVNPLINR